VRFTSGHLESGSTLPELRDARGVRVDVPRRGLRLRVVESCLGERCGVGHLGGSDRLLVLERSDLGRDLPELAGDLVELLAGLVDDGDPGRNDDGLRGEPRAESGGPDGPAGPA
jgi:hypothetical protein